MMTLFCLRVVSFVRRTHTHHIMCVSALDLKRGGGSALYHANQALGLMLIAAPR
jgi:hypothetical protein